MANSVPVAVVDLLARASEVASLLTTCCTKLGILEHVSHADEKECVCVLSVWVGVVCVFVCLCGGWGAERGAGANPGFHIIASTRRHA